MEMVAITPESVTVALATIKGGLDICKGILDLKGKFDPREVREQVGSLREQLLDAREACSDMREEILGMRERIAELEEKLSSVTEGVPDLL